MNRNHTDLDNLLDRAACAVRDEAIDETALAADASRVRSLLSDETASAAVAAPAEHLRGCADFESLIPSYLVGQLSEARTLLFEDHTSECVPCRRALKEARDGRRVSARPAVAAKVAHRASHTTY